MNRIEENNHASEADFTKAETENPGTAIITDTSIVEFQNALRENEHSEATIEKYSTAVRRLKEFLNGEPVVKERLLDFRSHLKEDHAAQTVNCAVSAINSYLELNGMTAMKIKHLKVQRSAFCPKEKELSMDEYDRLVKAAKDQGREQLSLIVETLGSTGIRASELTYITMESIRKREVEITLKGKIRTIMLTGKLCKKLIKFAGKKHISSGSIFLTRNGNPVSRKQIWAQMKSLCEKAGVEASKVFPHNLRHLFARRFYKLTKDIAKLADVLGHSSIETTRIYLKSAGDEHAKVLSRLKMVS